MESNCNTNVHVGVTFPMSEKYYSFGPCATNTFYLSEILLCDYTIGPKYLRRGRGAARVPGTPAGSDQMPQPPAPCTPTEFHNQANSHHQPNLCKIWHQEAKRLTKPGLRLACSDLGAECGH